MKIPNGYPEADHRRRSDNSIAKRQTITKKHITLEPDDILAAPESKLYYTKYLTVFQTMVR